MPRLVLNLQYADSQNIFILYENEKHDGYSMSKNPVHVAPKISTNMSGLRIITSLLF